jgi:WD40 repeat protein/uncharacterized caspase-like protein
MVTWAAATSMSLLQPSATYHAPDNEVHERRADRLRCRVLRRSTRSISHALTAALVITGCSVTVQPIRSPAGNGTGDAKSSSTVVALAPVLPDAPSPSCPNEPPPEVLDTTAKMVLQNGHEKPIARMVVSADGGTLASAATDGTIRVWDVRSGILLRKLGTAGVFALGMSLSADGKRLAYYAPDSTVELPAIQIVDLDRGAAPRPVTPLYGAFQLSSDGKKLAIASNKLMLFDVDTGALLYDVPLDLKGTTVAVAADFDDADARIALAAVGEIIVADAAKGKVLHRFAPSGPLATDTPMTIALLADHVIVRFGSGNVTMYPLTKTAPPRVLPGTHADMAAIANRVWVSDREKETVASFALPNLTPIELPSANAAGASVIAASNDGSTVVFAKYVVGSGPVNDLGTGTVIEARDAETMRPLRTIEGRETDIDAIALSPAAEDLVTGSFLGEIMRWSLRDGSLAAPLPRGERDLGRTVGLAYAPNGEFFASTTEGDLRVRDAKTGRTLRAWRPNDGYHLRFAEFVSKTNDLLTVAMRVTRTPKKGTNGKPTREKTYDVVVDRWNLDGPKPPLPKTISGEIARPPGKTIAQIPREAFYFALSPRGDELAIGDAGQIALLRTDTGATRWIMTLSAPIPDTKQQPDGVLDATRRWMTFSPDGKALLLSTRRKEKNKQGWQTDVPVVLVLDTSNGRITGTFPADTYGPVAWRKNAVFIGGPRPVLLDAPAMSVRARISAPDNTITAVALHPTRDLFVIGGDGGATSFVDERGGIAATLVATPNGEWIAAAPDGAYRSSIDGARSIAWSFASPLEGFSFERFASRFDKPDVVARRLTGEASPASVSLARPPRLELEAYRTGVVRTADRALTVTTTATSASRVDRVRAFVDGRRVAEALVCAKEGKVSLTIPLHAGQNRVGLVAYDAAGQASNTQSIDVVSTSPLAERPDLYVVAIGVSQYPNMTPDQQLDFADDDARSVTESFGRQAGSGKPFAKVFATTLLDDKVTVDSVEKAITSLRAMRPDDLGVVFFAGHGAKLAEGKMVFMTNQAAFTRKSAETYGIGWDKIHAGLSSVRGRVLMMLDACHSGYLTTEIIAPNEELARQLAAGDRAGVFVFSAARGSQFSFEVPPEGLGSASRGLELAWNGQKPQLSRELPGGHGLFTSALLEALSGDAPDRDRSGATEVGELVDYVTERVRAASNGQQTPWVARREMFGEFFVVPAKK